MLNQAKRAVIHACWSQGTFLSFQLFPFSSSHFRAHHCLAKYCINSPLKSQVILTGWSSMIMPHCEAPTSTCLSSSLLRLSFLPWTCCIELNAAWPLNRGSLCSHAWMVFNLMPCWLLSRAISHLTPQVSWEGSVTDWTDTSAYHTFFSVSWTARLLTIPFWLMLLLVVLVAVCVTSFQIAC